MGFLKDTILGGTSVETLHCNVFVSVPDTDVANTDIARETLRCNVSTVLNGKRQLCLRLHHRNGHHIHDFTNGTSQLQHVDRLFHANQYRADGFVAADLLQELV